MAASVAWYIGWILAAAGVLLTMRPCRVVGVPTRRRALLVLVAGLVLAATAVIYAPAPTRAPTPAATLLDPWLPQYHFSEAHQIDVHASREQVYRAITEVTPDEIALFRTLTWIRRLGRSSDAGILNPARGVSILQTALTSGFHILAEKPNEEIVLGTFVAAPRSVHGRDWTPADFLSVERPGFVKATMNFRLEASGADLTRVFTETRVYATDPATARAFTLYWRTIYPGSSLIRSMWLRAIKRNAEGRRAVVGEARTLTRRIIL